VGHHQWGRNPGLVISMCRSYFLPMLDRPFTSREVIFSRSSLPNFIRLAITIGNCSPALMRSGFPPSFSYVIIPSATALSIAAYVTVSYYSNAFSLCLIFVLIGKLITAEAMEAGCANTSAFFTSPGPLYTPNENASFRGASCNALPNAN
jgi:hypothetical protein